MRRDDVPEWTLGDRLRKSREYRGILQAEMAEHFDVSEATISNWETGARKPRGGEFALVSKWAKVTRVPEAWLAGMLPDVNR